MSYPKELIREMRKDNKRKDIIFILIWFLTFTALITMSILYIRLNNDIGVIETTTQEVTQDNTNGNNNYIGRDGDITNGKAKD